MLYAFGFDRIGVVVSDLFFVDPTPSPGQEGAERGVRLEVRLFERPELRGSIYSAQPIAIDRPIWRADLLEAVASEPGSFNRTHHHPAFAGWEPSHRVFEPELSADPLGFVAACLSDLDQLLGGAGFEPGDVGPGDADALRDAVPEIVDATRRLLDRVHESARTGPPPEVAPAAARVGWL